jgi:pSer/pThr/pTyr-binding forkhead associated (FHA) protein
MFLLTIETKTGVKHQKKVRTRSSTITLGREQGCQIVLRNTYFSRIHATLTDQGNGSWLVIDGSERRPSQAGLSVEGRKIIGSALLFEGQTLTLIDQLSVDSSNNNPADTKVDPDAGPSTQMLSPPEPIRATFKLLPEDEIQSNQGVTLSGTGGDIQSAQINQNLLSLIDKSDEMPKQFKQLKRDLFERILALENDKASAQMIDEALTLQLEKTKSDHADLINKLKRRLDQFEGKYKRVLIMILVVLVLMFSKNYTPEDLQSWVDLAEKLILVAGLFQGMGTKR